MLAGPRSVTTDEVGSASGVFETIRQLPTSLDLAVLGAIFSSAFAHHLPTNALQITAMGCLAPLAAAFLLIFRLPMGSRDEREQFQPTDPATTLST